MRFFKITHFIRLVVILSCIVYAFWGITLKQVLDAIQDYGWGFMIVGIAATAFALLFMSWRFHYLVKGTISFHQAIRVVLVGIGINNVFPAKAGEFAKVAYLRGCTGQTLACGANLVFWERFFDVQAIIVLCLISSVFIEKEFITLPLLGLALSGWILVILLQFKPKMFHHLAKKIPNYPLRSFMEEAFDHFSTRANLFFLIGLAFHTVSTWAAYILYYFLILNVGARFHLGLQEVVVVVAVTSVGLALPASPGGLGLLEASLVICLAWFDIARGEAIAAALVIRITQYLPTIVASLLILANSGIGISELIHGRSKQVRVN